MITNVKRLQNEALNRHVFELTFDGHDYCVVIFTDEKGKFFDEEISVRGGDELEMEGTDGEIREKIIDYLDENWDSLTK
jgi:hypothetical protein